MTDIKKKQTGKGGANAKKLQLNKETITDLEVKKGAGGNVKGGAQGRQICTFFHSGCQGE